MPKVFIDGAAIHRLHTDCEIADGTGLIEVRDVMQLEMKAYPEEICETCFPELVD
jgi:hypothetical protein